MNDIKIYTMQQGTAEWEEVRKLKFTASHASTIAAMGKGVVTLIDEMLADYYSTGIYKEYSEKYKNRQMQRGNDFEEKARQIYSLETGNTVKQVGFVEFDTYVGCSPDGLVNDDGLVEIKNHSDIVFLKLVQDKKIEKKYIDQMQYQMFVTNRKWCDYFAFNPNFTPSFVRIRVERDLEFQKKMVEAIPYAIDILLKKKEELDKILQKAA